jgi:hypothetical protein
MRAFKNTIFLVAVLGLSACGTNGVRDFSSFDSTLREPTAANGYWGTLGVLGYAKDADVLALANQICSTRGGLLTAPFPVRRVTNYQCKGFKPQVTQAPAQDPQVKTTSAPVQEKQINAPIQLVEQSKPAVAEKVDRLSLDASKQKCTELGFKPATEGYGKCVLQLSK